MSAHIYYNRPFPIKLPQGSPGCILPETKMHFFRLGYTSGSVIVNRGISKPPKDSHKAYYLKNAIWKDWYIISLAKGFN